MTDPQRRPDWPWIIAAICVGLAIVVAAALAVHAAEAAPRCRGQEGIASWYSYGSRTASGERFDPNGFTAAMFGVPFGTRVRVTDVATGRSVIVRINDIGGFRRLGRIIDLSRGAASSLGIIRRGTARVCLGAP